MTELIASSELVAVVGMGETGFSIARYLKAHNIKFMMLDTRTAPPNAKKFAEVFPSVGCEFGPLKSETLSRVTKIILSPGVDRRDPAIKNALDNGVPVVGDIQLFVEGKNLNQPIVAITGSNGKTTVTTLVGEMMLQAGRKFLVAGNIGTPVLDLLALPEGQAAEGFVLELSSFQLESTQKLQADVAVVLNVSADHMDRYDSFQDYHRAKQRIFFGAKTVVINRQDPLSNPPLSNAIKVISFGLDKPDLKQFGLIKEDGETFIAQGLKKLLNVKSLKLRGSHNIANALAALAMGSAMQLPIESMLKTLETFTGLPHRCQYLGQKNNIEFFNDSKGTNVGATLAAIDGLAEDGKKIVLIAGGESKGADFSPLRSSFANHLRALVTIGADAKQIAAIATQGKINSRHESSITEAVETAFEFAEEGDIVLLSPACASFDMFKNYIDRGEQYSQAVEGLVNRG